jgi:hypothetical protein
MKLYLKIAALFITAGVIIIVLLLIKEASKSESAIILGERKKLADSMDKNRAEKDPVYSRTMEDKLRFLDYRLAVAYNAENKPDEAIAVLRTLISSEEAKGQRGLPRRSRSYANEARYYEALIESFEIKKDEVGVEKAVQEREELLAKASELKKREEREEGHSVGLNAQ